MVQYFYYWFEWKRGGLKNKANFVRGSDWEGVLVLKANCLGYFLNFLIINLAFSSHWRNIHVLQLFASKIKTC